MRIVPRFSPGIPTQKSFKVASSVQTPGASDAALVEGVRFSRRQITALARKIKNPAAIDLTYVSKNSGRLVVTQDIAWNLLFPPVTAYLRRIFFRYEMDEDSIEEGVARTWLSVVKHFDSYDPGPEDCEAPFFSWLQTIAQNQARNMYKERTQWRSRHPFWIGGVDQSEDGSFVPEDNLGNPTAVAMQNDQQTHDKHYLQGRLQFDLFLLELGFERLPPREQSILVAVDQNGKSYGETARAQGFKLANLKTLIFRARRHVMKMFAAFREVIPTRNLHPAEIQRIESHRAALLKILELSLKA